jgi:hypothetical protein
MRKGLEGNRLPPNNKNRASSSGCSHLQNLPGLQQQPGSKSILYRNKYAITSTTRLRANTVIEDDSPLASTFPNTGHICCEHCTSCIISAHTAPSQLQMTAVHESEVLQRSSMPHALVHMRSTQQASWPIVNSRKRQ